MDPKEVKSALKYARECIKNKDYKEALRHCKVSDRKQKLNHFTLCWILWWLETQCIIIKKEVYEEVDSI